MENPVCIDTDILIDHLRGRSPGARLFADIVTRHNPYTTCITRFELMCGTSTSKEKEIIEECLLGFKVLPLDESSSDEAARIYVELKKKGQLIGVRDILIAGIAKVNNLRIATRNRKDFGRIKGLTIWSE